MTVQELINIHSDQVKILHNGGIAVALTPDDILTLRLLRDEYARQRLRYPDQKHRIWADELTLETLECILKQVE